VGGAGKGYSKEGVSGRQQLEDEGKKRGEDEKRKGRDRKEDSEVCARQGKVQRDASKNAGTKPENILTVKKGEIGSRNSQESPKMSQKKKVSSIEIWDEEGKPKFCGGRKEGK